MKRSYLVLLGLAGVLGLVTASAAGCKATTSDTFGSGGSGGDSSTSSAGNSGTGASGQGGNTMDTVGAFVGPGATGTGSTGSGGPTCQTAPDVDDDGDGFSEAAGDCNDCDANVSPGSIEVLADPADPNAKPADEDCDGTVDNVLASCDGNIALDSPNPMDGAKAIGLCQQTSAGEKKWGVLESLYVRVDGTGTGASLQNGIMSDFGPNVNVQEGSRMLVLSTGHARLPGQPGSCGSLSCSNNVGVTPPPGFPQDVPNCPGETNVNDDFGLQVKVRSPKNATGYKFNFKFYSFEYPEYVCTAYNDQFIALVSPQPTGSINGNISFDSMTNPVSVNVAFFNGLPADLIGTGFDIWNSAGCTTWLQTQAPIKGGDEVQIRFAIWDTGDSAWDSTVLIDNFQWVANGGTVVVGTDPVPVPK